MIQIKSKATNAEAMAGLRQIAAFHRQIGAAATIERSSRALAEAMAEIHGGQWNVTVNHDSCFVLVARDLLAD